AVAFIVTRGSTSGTSESATAIDVPKHKPKPKPPPELPRAGRHLFPSQRIPAYYGAPQNVELGALGIGTPDQAGKKLLQQMRPYRHGGRRLLPAMELIAVVAAGSAQRDGSYNYKQSSAVVKKYLAAARKIHALLILDI